MLNFSEYTRLEYFSEEDSRIRLLDDLKEL